MMGKTLPPLVPFSPNHNVRFPNPNARFPHPNARFPLQVSAVPVVFAVKGGNVADKFIGLQDLDRITSFIRSLLDK